MTDELKTNAGDGPVEQGVRPGAEARPLVERLRARLAGSICNPDGTYTVGNCPPDALCHEAATEIERLRAALEVSQAATEAAVSKAQWQAVTNLAPERAAYARWLAATHAPALRRMDSDGAHAAGYAAGVAAERKSLAQRLQAEAELDGFGCACAPPWVCGTCAARDTISKALGPLMRELGA